MAVLLGVLAVGSIVLLVACNIELNKHCNYKGW